MKVKNIQTLFIQPNKGSNFRIFISRDIKYTKHIDEIDSTINYMIINP